MGAISGMLGMAGGANGTGFSSPGAAPIANPTTPTQIGQTYNQAQQGLIYQNNLLNQLMGQNGIQNQSQVYGQLQNVASGQGPNPAQAMLNQATAANTANQAALMAGQRGSSSNVGLIARQAAQQGAANQQQAALGSATMQAQQQLAALGQMQGVAGQQVANQMGATGALNQAFQSEQGQILGAQQGYNQAAVSNQASMNSANAALAGQTMGLQGQLFGNVMGGAGAAFGLAEGGKVEKRKMYAEGDSVYQDIPAGYDPFANTSASLAQNPQIGVANSTPAAAPIQSASTPAGPRSSFGKRISSSLSKQSSNQSNMSPAQQGAAIAGNTLGQGIGRGLKAGYNALFGPSSPSSVQDNSLQQTNDIMFNANRPEEMEADPTLSNAANSSSNVDVSQMAAQGGVMGDINKANLAMMFLAKGGKVPALLSPGEQYLPPKDVKKVVKDGKNPLVVGKKVPGKPKHPGNDYRNDTVKATLKEGGIVIPNSVMQSENPPMEAMKFVQATMAKSKHKK